jgi:hypothetical protein
MTCSIGPNFSTKSARLFHTGVLRRDLRFAAGAVHVYHPSRNPPGPNPNDRYLFETLQGRRTWCAHGLDQHLPAPGR